MIGFPVIDYLEPPQGAHTLGEKKNDPKRKKKLVELDTLVSSFTLRPYPFFGSLFRPFCFCIIGCGLPVMPRQWFYAAYPRIVSPLGDVSVHVGHTLELTCNASADPAAHVQWTKESSELPTRAVFQNKNATLVIRDVTFDDEGRYSCLATNRQGNCSSSSFVEVVGTV